MQDLDDNELDALISEIDADVDVDAEDAFFCPAPHRPPILHIFTKHSSAIRSSLLALATQRREGKSASAPSKRCICTKRWPVWARSTSPLLSCLRTTMTVENHWRQLKAFAHRPRLDHAIHVICTAMVPAYMAIAAKLEDAYQHICKHLVQAVPKLPAPFFTEVVVVERTLSIGILVCVPRVVIPVALQVPRMDQ